ncbi:ribulose-phosphate 3-epimerase [Candidatus Daviesbacteria bacterium]|nr:ribulose-phosphate 3-epimerase [Candidatus Daviesbacteria bacterium]
MIQIIPTLFSTTEEGYRERLAKLSSSSLFKEGWVQLDLMDNKFVPNLSIGLDVIRKYPLPYKKEAQLMVMNPGEWIDGLIDLRVDRIIFPVEIKGGITGYINQIKSNKMEAGLSLNPETNTVELDSYLELLDSVLLMAVKPGLEGQKFDVVTYEKIKLIKQKKNSIKVGVDGGVNDTNIKDLVDAGADYVAIGSYLFNGDIDENLENLWEVLNGT